MEQAASADRMQRHLTSLAALVAPVTLLGGALLYFAGYTLRASLLNSFGIHEGLFTGSLQEIIAWGVLPISALVNPYGLLLFGGWIVINIVLLFLSRFWDVLDKVRDMFNGLFTVDLTDRIGFAFASLAAISVATGIGFWFGNIAAGSLKEEVRNGCHTGCYVYDDGRVGVVGKLLMQNAQNTAVVTSKGVRLLPTASIWKVRPYLPNSDEGHPNGRTLPQPARSRPDEKGAVKI
ncbi:hypothetical protein [Sphingomonas xinjiangensis]|uniref:Uncharacterized protein n=1 Tax=Sphingomonas xinjiangensis TaxID=643568 RepID=A0A840Y804_9SPHN|nr:hypothetical protein [Sphingomonas xinjiangensis]MBB5709427.1 hypothetical protein [Sphingomonas xinjiangensis]